MREVATILVKNLNVHRVPGDRKEDIVGEVKRDDTFTVFERHRGDKARWLRIGVNRWIAERNHSGAVFARVDRVADPLPTQPTVIAQDSRKSWWPWIVTVLIAIAGAAGIIYQLWR